MQSARVKYKSEHKVGDLTLMSLVRENRNKSTSVVSVCPSVCLSVCMSACDGFAKTQEVKVGGGLYSCWKLRAPWDFNRIIFVNCQEHCDIVFDVHRRPCDDQDAEPCYVCGLRVWPVRVCMRPVCLIETYNKRLVRWNSAQTRYPIVSLGGRGRGENNWLLMCV